ncbi:hypothetical protein ACN47E_008509 [Coniothyrium glycines]
MPPKRGGFRGGRGGHGGTFKYGIGAKKRSSPGEEDGAPRTNKKAKADEEEEVEEGANFVPELRFDDDGNQFVGLNASGKRRVTVSDFNKSTLVSIREYYTTDAGELKPGKKGISLTIDQYNALLAAAPLIEAALAKKDIQVVRPDYEADLETKVQAADENEEDDEEKPQKGNEDDEQD